MQLAYGLHVVCVFRAELVGVVKEKSDALTLYQPMTAKAVMSSHKPIRIYMGNLKLGVIP